MLFVTLHGGKPQQNPHKNNVHAYDKTGKKLTSSVLKDKLGVLLDELRAIRLFEGDLYIVNANKAQNSILRYQGSGRRYKFAGSFASAQTCEGILHPFDVVFDGAGYCYVSSQDTNVVTRLKIAPNGKTASPAPIAPALPHNGKFLPGTFVASSVGSLSHPRTTPVSTPAGLAYTAQGQKKHSVRGLLWANNALYVADEPAGTVKIYDATGKFLGQSNQVKSPVHLAVYQGQLYVSGANHLLTAKPPKPPGNFTLAPVPNLRIKNAGGVVFTKSGHCFIASRTNNFIKKFDANDNFQAMKFTCATPDNPEFLLHIKS